MYLRHLRWLAAGLSLAILPQSVSLAEDIPPDALLVARQVLAADDGWAAADGGTTGGSTAQDANIRIATTRAELIAALGGDNRGNGKNATPTIIFIKGRIDLGSAPDGRTLTQADYAQGAFDAAAYRQAYDPAVWGKRKVAGPLEDARAAAAKRQAEQITIEVGSNKTLIGLGRDATITGGTLRLAGVENVILRNIAFEDAYDHFPQWDPTDGEFGEWNSEYDLVVLTMGTRRVWIDHCSFSDGSRPDDQAETVFGREMQHHDGAVDVVRQASLVTLSFNHFRDHDKTLLFGNSDSRKEDDGFIKVTLHHNWFENITQRSPRVRYGTVHSYNNLHTGDMKREPYPFLYGFGVGISSAIVSQNDVFDVKGATAADLVMVLKGTRLTAKGTLLNGVVVDPVAARNEADPKTPISNDAQWLPLLVNGLQPAEAVAATVRAKAGTGKLGG